MIFRNPDTVHGPLASYSHQAEVKADAKWLILSAQIGMDKNGHVPENVLEQTQIALDNIRLNLEAADMNISNLAKLVFYFGEAHDTAKRRDMVAEWLGDHRPCMTVIFVTALAALHLKVEVEAWACS